MKENNKLRKNDYLLLKTIFDNENITALELSEKMEVTPAMISKTIKKLKEQNYLIEDLPKKSVSRGRPRKVLAINSDYKKILGVNFGSDFIDVCVGNLNGDIIESRRKTRKSN